CGLIAPKSRFRRCGGCQIRWFCSRECQALDWKQDGHRDACASLSIATWPDHARSRDRGFMRVIVHRAYLTSRTAILLHQLKFMHQHPGTPFYTTLDMSLATHGP
ncbi:hypothetical protein C8R46DRAFT_1056805, partial [Mycena filopes]